MKGPRSTRGPFFQLALPSCGALDDEESLWGSLAEAVGELNDLGLSPQLGDTVTSAEDLYGDEFVLEVVKFADFEDDGNIQYDDHGIKTIVRDYWL